MEGAVQGGTAATIQAQAANSNSDATTNTSTGDSEGMTLASIREKLRKETRENRTLAHHEPVQPERDLFPQEIEEQFLETELATATQTMSPGVGSVARLSYGRWEQTPVAIRAPRDVQQHSSQETLPCMEEGERDPTMACHIEIKEEQEVIQAEIKEEPKSEANSPLDNRSLRRMKESAGATPKSRSIIQQGLRRDAEEEERTVLSEPLDSTMDEATDVSWETDGELGGSWVMAPLERGIGASKTSIDPAEDSEEPSSCLDDDYTGEYRAPCFSEPYNGAIPRVELHTTATATRLDSSGSIIRKDVQSPTYPGVMRRLHLHQEEDGREIPMRILKGSRLHPSSVSILTPSDSGESTPEAPTKVKKKRFITKVRSCTLNLGKGILKEMEASGASTRAKRNQLDRLRRQAREVEEAADARELAEASGVTEIKILHDIHSAVQFTREPLLFGGQDIFMSMPASMYPHHGVRRFFCEMDFRIPQAAFDLQTRVGDVARVPFFPEDQGEDAAHVIYLIIDRLKWEDPLDQRAFENGMMLLNLEVRRRKLGQLATIRPPRFNETSSLYRVREYFEKRFDGTDVFINVHI